MKLLLAMAFSIPGAVPAQEVRQRVLIVQKDPTPATERMLTDPTVGETEASRSGLVKVTTDRFELLIAEDLWNPSSIRLATLAMRAVASGDGTTPMTVDRFPAQCQRAILDQLNRAVQTRRGPVFGPHTEIEFNSESWISVSDGKTTESFSVVQKPKARKIVRTEVDANAPNAVIPPVTPKRTLIVRFPTPLSDRVYWENVSAAYKALDDHRRALEDAFQKESDEIARSRFPEDPLSSLRAGDDLASIPSSLYDRQFARLGPDASGAFRQNARISEIQRSLLMVVRVGNKEFAFSPRAMFEP